MINNFFSESKKNFLIEKRETFQKKGKKERKKKKCEKRSNRKNKDTGSEKLISLRFREIPKLFRSAREQQSC